MGAGHNGLSIAARLQALDVPTLVIDRQARVGDQWRKRYASLALHSSVYGDHLPYLPLPPTWTEHTPKDKFAEFLESYATLLDLNVWTSTTFLNAHYDESAQRWTVRVRREDGSIRELHPRHFVVAAGLYGRPKIPEIPGLETFTGVYTHSDEFQDGDRYAGQDGPRDRGRRERPRDRARPRRARHRRDPAAAQLDLRRGLPDLPQVLGRAVPRGRHHLRRTTPTRWPTRCPTRCPTSCRRSW